MRSNHALTITKCGQPRATTLSCGQAAKLRPSLGVKWNVAGPQLTPRFIGGATQRRDSVGLPADWRQAQHVLCPYYCRTAKHSCSFFSSYIERGHLRARARCLTSRPQNYIQAHVARGTIAAIGLPDFEAGARAQLLQFRNAKLMGVAQAAAAALPVE